MWLRHSRLSPLVKMLQAAEGYGAPMEATCSNWLSFLLWQPASVNQLMQKATAAMGDLYLRAAASAHLATLFWQHSLQPTWSEWLQLPWQHNFEDLETLGKHISMHQHPGLVAARVDGVEPQLASILQYLSQQRSGVEMYCSDAVALARAC